MPNTPASPLQTAADAATDRAADDDALDPVAARAAFFAEYEWSEITATIPQAKPLGERRIVP